ncbi:MAG: ABC transporter permease, partial [Clostridia bacterium]|nr:ABC transporter permease [Clostridia bacterium]
MASLICIVIGLVVGLIILLCINPEHAIKDGFIRILQGGFYMMPSGVGTVLANAAPLIMTGLSVAFAFKTGLFNIGVAGQYTVGAFGGLYAAIVLGLPWWGCLLFSTLFGGIWGAIPGLFKAYLNVNEVITAIMFNWIGLYGVNTLMYGGGKGPMYDSAATKSWSLRTKFPAAVIPGGSEGFMGTTFDMPSTTIAIFLAIAVAILIFVVLNRTTFGYELKACGHNKDAAKYAGINDKRNIVLSMLIAGALAGFGAGLYYLSGVAEWNPQVSTALPAMGWNGIPAALLAANNPLGVIFSALLVSHITVGGNYMPTRYFTKEIADVITGVIIYLCAFSLLFQGALGKFFRRGKKSGRSEVTRCGPCV